MRSLIDEIMFEVRIKNLSEDVQKFLRWIPEDGSEPDDFYGGYTYQAWCVTAKSEEGEPAEEDPEEEGHEEEKIEEEILYKNRKRGKKFNKSAWVRKERKKSLHNLVDWKDGIDWWQSVDDGGRKIGEKGDKLYTRKGRTARDKFTEEPFNPWYDPDYLEDVDYETGLHLPVGTGYWSDETISEAINNHNDPYYDYDWEEILEDDEEELEELDEILDDDDDEVVLVDAEELDEILDDDDDEVVLVDAEEGDDELVDGLRQLNRQLELEVRKLYDFINEYNLNKLFSQWEKSH